MKILTQWDCKCGKTNPIENRVCRSCLAPIPFPLRASTVPLFKAPFWMFDNGFQRKIIDDNGAEILSTSSSGLDAKELDSQKQTLLILAAAPEMLEALKDIRATAPASQGSPYSIAFEKALKKMDLAIAKAEGARI